MKLMNKEEILKMWKEIVGDIYFKNETRSPIDAFAEWHIKEVERIIEPIKGLDFLEVREVLTRAKEIKK